MRSQKRSKKKKNPFFPEFFVKEEHFTLGYLIKKCREDAEINKKVDCCEFGLAIRKDGKCVVNLEIIAQNTQHNFREIKELFNDKYSNSGCDKKIILETFPKLLPNEVEKWAVMIPRQRKTPSNSSWKEPTINTLQEFKNHFNVECDNGQGFMKLVRKYGKDNQYNLKFIISFLSKIGKPLYFQDSAIEKATIKERDILITVSCSGSNYDQIRQVLNETVHFLPLPNKEISDQFIEDFLKLAETVKLKPLRQDDNSNLNESPINSNSNSNSEIDFDLTNVSVENNGPDSFYVSPLNETEGDFSNLLEQNLTEFNWIFTNYF
ncbi:hypothetical protein M9Y10_007554 [Tritrichomonas musculus]|uniref:Initiator binding domain-containing protein n=1 Tax=Tritrichomonas musculus TaxID=1915356 RepID=A0ABR2J2N6_9EUKA